jgi:hypothetical protein
MATAVEQLSEADIEAVAAYYAGSATLTGLLRAKHLGNLRNNAAQAAFWSKPPTTRPISVRGSPAYCNRSTPALQRHANSQAEDQTSKRTL